MIHFMYHDTYDTSVLPVDKGAILLHIRVFALARKYFIEPLQGLAKTRTLESLEDWDNVVFAQAVKEIYALTAHNSEANELRAASMSIVQKNALKLFGPESEPHHRLMRETFEETPGLMSDLAGAMATQSHEQIDFVETLQTAAREDRAEWDSLLIIKKEQKDLLEKTRSDLSVTEADLVKTQAELSTTKTRLDQANREAYKLRDEATKQPKHPVPVVPKHPWKEDDSEMKWYLCPNCNTVFARVILAGMDYVHQCYSSPWYGHQSTSTVQMSRREWAKHSYEMK